MEMSDEGKGLPAAPESTQILPVDATPSAPAVDGIPAEPDTTPSDPIERTEKPDDPSSESVEPTVGDPKACEETVQEELTRLREENQSSGGERGSEAGVGKWRRSIAGRFATVVGSHSQGHATACSE